MIVCPMPRITKADIQIDHACIDTILFIPITPDGRYWLESNRRSIASAWWAGQLQVDKRYVESFSASARSAGMVVVVTTGDTPWVRLPAIRV